MAEETLPSENRSGSHFRVAWRTFKADPGPFVLAALILLTSWAALEILVIALHPMGVVVNVALHLAFLVWFSGLMAGLHAMALRAIDGRAIDAREITALLGRGPALLLAFCLVAAGCLAGLALLVAPGIYVGVRFCLFGPVLAEAPITALEALRRAAALTAGRWWKVGLFVLKAAALNIAGAALLGLGPFVTFPVSVLAAADLYRGLRANGLPPETEAHGE